MARVIVSLLRVCAVLAFAAGFCTTPALAEDWPDIEVPPRSRVEWVGRDMKLNGMPMQVRKFESPLGISEILAFYRAHWGTQQEKKSVESRSGDWTIIGRAHGPYYLTVQMKTKANVGTEGLISVSMLNSRIKPEFPLGGFPVPGGTKVLSVLDSNDPGKTSKQIKLANDDSVISNAHYFETALGSSGWTRKTMSERGQHPDQASYDVFQKDNQELHLVIVREPGRTGTLIVANTVAYTN
ncbi:MAG TPA: hypothetical protein VF427_05890 [Noviherbaspirillum sp.]